MNPVTLQLVRIASVALLGFDCTEAAGLGHGLLPLGGTHIAQIAILLGGSLVLGEFIELAIKPLMQKLLKKFSKKKPSIGR